MRQRAIGRYCCRLAREAQYVVESEKRALSLLWHRREQGRRLTRVGVGRFDPPATGVSALRPALHHLRAGRRHASPVVKRNGREEVFTRAKLLNGLLRACEKRGIPLGRIELIADDIEGELRRESVQRVASVEIGERALRHLRELDKVAYIRFASVYRQFEDIDEFQEELARL